jgi:hypothetical protein
MKLDKNLYHQARQSYLQLNQAELLARVHNVGGLTPRQAWVQYAGLWELCLKLAPQPSQYQRLERVADLERYYQRMQKIESWRQTNGKIA